MLVGRAHTKLAVVALLGGDARTAREQLGEASTALEPLGDDQWSGEALKVAAVGPAGRRLPAAAGAGPDDS